MEALPSLRLCFCGWGQHDRTSCIDGIAGALKILGKTMEIRAV